MNSGKLRAEDHEIAYAKINLALHVLGRRSDGYHELDTVFAFLNRGDEVSVSAGEGLHLSISGPFAEQLSTTHNLTLDAANLLAGHCDITANAHLALAKHLPIASGIGGGSADAAAALRLLNRFWGADLSQKELVKLAEPLGADVPACVFSQTVRARGIGHEFESTERGDVQSYHVLLANPKIELSTTDVFGKWHESSTSDLVGSNLLSMALAGKNDLEKPAIEMVPAIGDILAILSQTSCVLARMSGSGATCFGLYETEANAKAAESRIIGEFPEIWTMTGKIR